uniref:Protocadherin Fat 3-like n=1 Tax=Saccoglossus kowalevskii TaxID=10224 RepID=A0ABM0M2F6_SACKO|nr:PREDICTED: protocadherin Fat 3-like [Saccoglossus kowalevskii]
MVTATDKDEGTNGDVVRYTIIDGDGTFQINETTGKISVNQSLDYENGDEEFIYLISAEDALPRTGTTTVTISVQNINDAPPVFVTPEYNYTVYENSRPGISVGYIEALDPDGDNLSYSLNDTVNNAFSMDSNTGLITVSGTGILDREELDRHTLVVLATDGVYIATSTVTVAILDENDNSPKFEKSVYYGNVTENTFSNATILQVLADDLDIGANADIIYSILATSSHGDDRFSIDGDSGDISVQSNADLDYELVSSYVITVQAVDNPTMDTQQRSSVVTVYIDIIDINDVMPEFADSSYVAYVNEAVAMDTSVIQIQATDADLSPNDDVMYYISSGNHGNHFDIDNSTGGLSVISAIDVETEQSQFIIEITVYNTEPYVGNQLNNTVNVTVNIQDINNNGPLFENTTYAISIPEDTELRSPILRLTATDVDTITSYFIYWISNGNNDGIFDINEDGDIIVIGDIDRDPPNNNVFFNLTVTVSDGDSNTDNDTTSVIIAISDVNDNSPVFSQETYRFTADEGVAVATSVGMVTATDKDEGTNGEVVSYAIMDGDGTFGIDETSGEISVNRSLDFENGDKEFRFTVVAHDGGLPQQNGSVSIVISINNTNDEEPAFSVSTYNFTAYENSRQGTPVGKVEATDPDHDILSYFIITSASLFTVDENSGQIIVLVSGSLDREVQDSYNVVVIATDGVYSTSTNITIAILDENDNSPIFMKSGYYGNVTEDVDIGSEILQVSAQDEDVGDNANVEYSILATSSNGDGIFGIHNSSGSLFILDNINVDYETTKSYVIVVQATDQPVDSFSRSSVVTVYIDIMDINDVTPQFSESSYVAYVNEAVAMDTSVIQIQASDVDTVGTLVYSVEGSDSFKVDNTSGIVKTVDLLDREMQDMYEVQLSVNDGIHSTSVNVTIYVEDNNDNSPVFEFNSYNFNISEGFTGLVVGMVNDINNNGPLFENATYTISIPEDTELRSPILRVTATDMDTITSYFIYWISNGNNDGIFDINEDGDIIVIGDIDRDPPYNYTFFNLTVTVSDGDSNTNNDTTNVQITISDVNDNSPVFEKVEYIFMVNENSTVGTIVGSVHATDIDDGSNGEILSYDIINGDDTFSMNNQTGNLMLTSVLDPSLNSKFTLTVSAMDGGSIPKTGSTVIIVTITDVNNNIPVFLSSNYSFTVYENSRSDTSVGKVSAMDSDDDVLSYFILDTVPFSIDEDTGVIKVISSLDRENVDSYNVVVMVTDGVYSASANATIAILDENDNSPIFMKSTYYGNVTEDVDIGMEILQVEASDVDLGGNADVDYSILAASGNGDSIFGIHGNNGSIFILNNTGLDFELMNIYVISVQATDHPVDSESRSSVATVYISIEDMNDEMPLFGQSEYVAYINEEVTIATSVIQIQATDEDTVGVLAYSVHDDSSTFTIHNESAIVSTTELLDRESHDKYVVTISVTDGKFSNNVNLTVYIEDTNDNSPQFDISLYIFNISEGINGTNVGTVHASDIDLGINADISYSFLTSTRSCYYARVFQDGLTVDEGRGPVGSVFLTVEATDADLSPNDDVMYYISSGNHGNHFDIDNSTGGLSVISAIDVETEQSLFIIEITVYNTEPYVGNQVMNNTVNVTVNIQDINNNGPLFKNTTYTISIPEDIELRSPILRVTATDMDTITSYFIYWISNGNNDGIFDINEDGDIIVIGDIDRDPPNNNVFYNLTISVSDMDGNTLNDSAIVKITIDDVNDNAPLFDQVLTVLASDIDSGDNGMISRYSLDGDDVFSIDDISGNISLVDRLDYESGDVQFTYVVSAVDGGLPNNTGTVSLIITILNENDETPVFNSDSYSFTILENAVIDTFVGRVMATDADGDTIIYTVNPTDVPFVIDSETGDIIVSESGVLDRETWDNYRLIVTAFDGLHDVNATVDVHLLDENDNTPEFPPNEYSGNMTEDEMTGFTILQVVALDEDEGMNSNVTFSIITGNHGNAFGIMDDGSVFLANSSVIDIANYVQYSLTVQATDGGEFPRSSITMVIINILDVNNNPPVFQSDFYTVDVSEEQSAGIQLIQVIAVDADPDSVLLYSITDDSLPFTINNVTGEISTSDTLDRETTESWLLNVSCSDGLYEDYTIINVTVLDVNDNEPEFLEGEYKKTISEIFPVGNVILTVSATDADEMNEMVYFLEDSNSKFAVNYQTGAITLQQIITGFDFGIQHTFSVKARDSGSPPKESSVQVTILINFNITANGTQEYPPFFNDTYSASVQENITFGSHVVTVQAFDVNVDDRSNLLYSIVGGSGANFFSIDKYSGEMKTSAPIDREIKNIFDVNVTATDPTGLTSVVTTVTITVEDVNDNSPEFTGLPYQTSITEGNITSDIFSVIADDDDEGANGDVVYGLSSFPSLFSIDNVTGMIFGLASLDREAPGLVINNNGEAVYELLVTAEDQGNDPLTSDIVVTVYVQDINDNPPVFTEDTYTADVPEDASADRSIITVSVTDNDWNNTITFSLQSDGNTNGAFTIDEMSGVVTLTGDGILDVRDNDFYNLTVEADDGLNTNQATILITVLEINLYNPVFNQSLGYVYSINENDYPGALSVVTVGSVWATDDDGDAIIYSIFAGNQDGIFVIDENGQISTNGTLNREDQDVYSLTIAAMDDRTSPRLGLVEVIVNILDVNDNDPVISSSDLTASISENVETGTQLLMTPTVFVSDADIAGNGDVTLRLEGAGSSDFSLVLNTDNTVTISVDGDIDRENKEMYDLLLIAEDGGSPSRSTNSTLKVNVLDINDNSPVFNETRYTATISEKQPSQTALNMNQPITVYDIDDSPYNFIIYAVESGSNQDKFRIDPLDGTIYAVQSFDYDAGDTEFNLTISAQNPGRSDVDVAVVTITVIDITETTTVVPSTPAPTTDTPEDYFNFLDEEDYDQTISSEISPSNETITQVIAVNPDGVSEGIFYNITNQTVQVYPKGPEVPASNFVIDPDTGIITLVEDLNGDIGLYELEITAWNGTESTTITVELIVVSPNNTAPHFKSPSYEAEITDTDPSGTDVVKVMADDDDAPVYGNGQIRFEVDEDNPITDYFQIDNTGMITVKKSLLPIVTFSVNFMVFVFDGGLPQLNDSTLVSVNITRQYGNLHTPVIVPPITSINLPENTAVNSIIHVVYAIDADSDINGEVFYDIQYVGSLSGNAMAAFDIDPLTGNITTISEFDFDKGSKYYQIMVYAEDKGYPSRKGYGVVGITITDVNDEPPMFIQPVGTYHVTENVFNASVGVVMATDIDSGDNAYIEYSITGGNDGNEFTIIPETGELFTNVELDREENGMYTLTVTATNSKAAPHFMDAITMTISVDDVNDNAPEFFSYSSLVVIPMTTPVNDVITTVQANDTDLGANAAVFYMLSQGNDHFTVNRDSGDITTTVSLNNGEALQTFQLTVVAYDGGYSRLESSIDVTIKVLDYSTGQPTFTGIDVQEFIMPVAMENENPGSYSELIPAAYDPLDEDGNDIRYHIVAGNDDGYFMLDPVTRILTTLITLDRESILEHKLVIRATTVRNTTTTGRRKRDTDLGANEMYIVVPIGDSNDNKPVFQQDTYVKGIMDDIGYGSSVLQVEALDLDAGNFSLVWYYHDNTTTTSLFDIQRHAGVVNTADVFSDKSGDTYSFKVTARDNHGEGLELANLTGLIIDDSKVGPRVDGDQVYPDETDLWFYGIDPNTNEIVSAKDILDLISQSPQQPGDLDIDDFEKDWKVTEITEIYNKVNKVPVSVSGIEAALFVLGIFILFASIFSIIAVFVWWEKREAERICKKAFWMDMYPLPLSGAGVENPAYLHVLAESHIGNTNAVDETDRATLDQGTTYVTRAGKTYKLGPDGEPVEVPTSDKLREPVYVEIGTSMSDDWIQARIVEGSLPNPLKEGMRDDGGYESQELTMDMFMDTSDFNDDVEAEDLLLRLESVEPVIVDNKGFIPDTGFSEGVPFTKV